MQKSFQTYLGDDELQQTSEIISGTFPRAEIKLFQTDVDEGWNNCEMILFRV